MRHREIVHETLHRNGLINGVEIFAMQALDQRERERRVVGNLANERRYALETGHLGRVPAPLACNDLELAALGLAHEYRL